MVTLLKGVQWTAEDEYHLRFVDPEEMKLVIEECKAQKEENRWGESKKAEVARTANIPFSMYRIPHYRKYFHCGNSVQAGEMRQVLLDRLSDLRASRKR
jgi:hypothetical protein